MNRDDTLDAVSSLLPVGSVMTMMAVPFVPGYDLLNPLGGGLLTAVYAGRVLDTDEPCAVKVLRPDWEHQPMAVKLLQREARALLAVRHARIVPVLDTHVLTPPHFLVMALLAGETLRRRQQRDYALDAATALWVARQTAEGIAALHRKGFVHGDVKPDNVFLTADGQAVLLDLGFAHRPGENASFLEQGYLLGTVNYLAPELCGRTPNDDDLRADMFSFGVMLFELLTGRLPYATGSAEETLRRHGEQAPERVPPHGLPRGVPELVARLLAFDPRERPRAEALVQELIGHEIAALGHRRFTRSDHLPRRA